jgi:hypothetical protein
MSSPEIASREIERIVAQRKRAERFLRILLPTKIHDAYGSLKEAHEHVDSGRGLLIISNHFGLRDGPQVFSCIPAKDDSMLTKTWTAPIAKHQYPVAHLLDTILHSHLDLKPVVTPDTKRKFPDTRLGQGLKEYVDEAMITLSTGGILVLFPQAERQSYLGVAGEDTKAMSLLVNRTSKAHIDNYVILPIGFSMSGVTDYEKAKGPNIGKTYDVSVGRLWTKEEMLSDARCSGLSIDGWAFGQLEPLVPAAYKTTVTT